MIASITGMGWVDTTSMGWGQQHEQYTAGHDTLPKVTSRMIFGKGLPHFGRLDTYSKIGIAAIAFALKDAGLFEWQEKRVIGVVASTTCGCLERDMEYIETMLPHGGRFASPNLFACTLPNVFIGQAAIHLGLAGPCYSVNEDRLSGVAGLRMALNNIFLDESPAIIAGLCDAGGTDVFGAPEGTRPGALFFVLQPSPTDGFSYGTLEMNETGDISFEGMAVTDLWELQERCLGERKRAQMAKRPIASITGMGWVDTTSMGWGRQHERYPSGNGSLPKITSRMVFGKRLSHFGRLDTYSKIGIAAIAFALKDAGLFEWQEKRVIGVLSSTTYGCIDTDIDYLETAIPQGGRFASPNLFAYVLSNIFLGEAAIHLGLAGPCYSVNEENLSGLTGLRMALTSILLDEAPTVVAGLCDAGRPDSFETLAETKPGALFFVLEEPSRDTAPSYGNIEMDDKGDLSFHGKKVSQLWELMHMCLYNQTNQEQLQKESETDS